MERILELLIRLLFWAFTYQDPGAQKAKKAEEPNKTLPDQDGLPPRLRQFICDEVERARNGQPWGRNEFGMPPRLLTALRAEIEQQIEGKSDADPFAEMSLPPRMEAMLRQVIRQHLK